MASYRNIIPSFVTKIIIECFTSLTEQIKKNQITELVLLKMASYRNIIQITELVLLKMASYRNIIPSSATKIIIECFTSLTEQIKKNQITIASQALSMKKRSVNKYDLGSFITWLYPAC